MHVESKLFKIQKWPTYQDRLIFDDGHNEIY